MGYYTKKPVSVEAHQWDGTAAGATRIINWVLENGGTASWWYKGGGLRASPGDFIVKGVKGEFYSCRPDIFQETHDEKGGEFVDETSMDEHRSGPLEIKAYYPRRDRREAVLITEDNVSRVANWCGGSIFHETLFGDFGMMTRLRGVIYSEDPVFKTFEVAEIGQFLVFDCERQKFFAMDEEKFLTRNVAVKEVEDDSN